MSNLNVNYRNVSPNRDGNYNNPINMNYPPQPTPPNDNRMLSPNRANRSRNSSPSRNTNPSSNPSSPLMGRGRVRRSTTPNPSDVETGISTAPQPLVESDLNPASNEPPLAGPEIDDLDENAYDENAGAYPGVDDGFVDTRIGNDNRPTNINPGVPTTENFPNNIPVEYPNTNDPRDQNYPPINTPVNPNVRPNVYIPNPDNNPGKQPFPEQPRNVPMPNSPPFSPPYNPGPFPYAPGFGPPNSTIPVPEIPREDIPDVNLYQHKKTLAQGMMDLALFSANANQLRYVLETFNRHPYYYPSIVLISLSLLLQVAVGVGLIWNSRYDVKNEVDICIANKVNNYTVIGIFIVTVINVFISAFGVANSN